MKYVLSIFAILVFASCKKNEDSEDKTQVVNKEGAIETSLDVQHIDSTHDVLVTTHQIWKRFSLVKTIETRDTIPALDKFTTEAENSKGDKKMVTTQRDYEFFITVK